MENQVEEIAQNKEKKTRNNEGKKMKFRGVRDNMRQEKQHVNDRNSRRRKRQNEGENR